MNPQHGQALSLVVDACEKGIAPLAQMQLFARASALYDTVQPRRGPMWVIKESGLSKTRVYRLLTASRTLTEQSVNALTTRKHDQRTLLALSLRTSEEQAMFWLGVGPTRTARDLWKRFNVWATEQRGGEAEQNETEHPWMNTLSAAICIAFGRNITCERRNVGQVVRRDRSGKATGVFKASSVNGAADLFGVYGPIGHHYEVETKAKKGVLSDDQLKFAARCAEVGTTYIVLSHDPSQTMDQNVERGVRVVRDALLEAEQRLREWGARIPTETTPETKA
jgi:hypothetical protein